MAKNVDIKANLPLMRYRVYLKLEKSLQPKTVEAYLGDIDKLQAFLKEEEVELLAVTVDDLRGYLACRCGYPCPFACPYPFFIALVLWFPQA